MSSRTSKKEKDALVTVVIPFFNREDFLGEAIESVLKQTYGEFEIVLVDDGSTDNSGGIAKDFVSRLPEKVVLLSHPGRMNRGASASRRLGIDRARGDFVTFLDSDDVLYEGALDLELNAFRANPDADAVCGTLRCWFSWSDAAAVSEKDFDIDLVLETGRLYKPPELLVHNLSSGGRKPGINCVMVRTDFARRFGVFEENYEYAWEDQVFWAKVCLHGKVFVIDSRLAKYRQHPASTCAVESESGRDTPNMNIFLDWLDRYVQTEGLDSNEVQQASAIFRRKVAIESKVLFLKQLYRKYIPLETRYSIRNGWIRLKKTLSRSPHRHK